MATRKEELLRELRMAQLSENKLKILTHLKKEQIASLEVLLEATGLSQDKLDLALKDCIDRGLCSYDENKKILILTGKTKEVEKVYVQFAALDVKVKKIVTEWQGRYTDQGFIPNTHEDVDYDLAIIERLREVHSMLITLLQPLTDFSQEYIPKLNYALKELEEGILDYMAKFTIESYHTVWLRLHKALADDAGVKYVSI